MPRFASFLLFAIPILSFLLPTILQTSFLPQWKWQMFAFSVFSGHFISCAITAGLLFLIENSSRTIKGNLPYAYAVKKTFEHFLWSAMLLTNWICLIDTPLQKVGETNPAIKTITKILSCVVVSTVILGAKNVAMKAVSISFHRRHDLEEIKSALFSQYILLSLLHPLDDLNQVTVERDFIVNVSPNRRGHKLLWSPITFAQWRLISPNTSTDWEVWNLVNFIQHANVLEEALQQLPHHERNNAFVAEEILRRVSKSESRYINFKDLKYCMPKAIAEEAWKLIGTTNGKLRRDELFIWLSQYL